MSAVAKTITDWHRLHLGGRINQHRFISEYHLTLNMMILPVIFCFNEVSVTQFRLVLTNAHQPELIAQRSPAFCNAIVLRITFFHGIEIDVAGLGES